MSLNLGGNCVFSLFPVSWEMFNKRCKCHLCEAYLKQVLMKLFEIKESVFVKMHVFSKQSNYKFPGSANHFIKNHYLKK